MVTREKCEERWFEDSQPIELMSVIFVVAAFGDEDEPSKLENAQSGNTFDPLLLVVSSYCLLIFLMKY